MRTIKKILLVDDEKLILHALTKTLKQCGAQVTAVATGMDALREIRNTAYDACFLDVHLPDANGLDLMKDIEGISPGTAIVIMTAEHLEADQVHALWVRGCDYLPKPFDLDHVFALVAKVAPDQSVAH